MRDRQALDLFLVSWLVLFLELACIRWFPAHVLFLTFFTNTVLLACFVGMSIGCLVARRSGRLLRRTPYLVLAAVGAGLVIDQCSQTLMGVLAVGDQSRPDEVFFGAENAFNRPLPFRVPIELVAGAFFTLIAGIMVGPGQEMGRAFNRVTSRTTAYSANLLGSLAGIALFAGISYLQLPPLVWFGISLSGLAYLLERPDPEAAVGTPRRIAWPLACLVLTLALTGVTSGLFPGLDGRETTWSPYYRIDYYPDSLFIYTNKISQQVMEPQDSAAVAPYALPYLFQRDLKRPDGNEAWPRFKRILIIGAGSGNDVARALRWSTPDSRIDAVEIDPVIQSLGAQHHPDRPFQDDRVTVHLTDGRNFLREANAETYDLVVFALIDSLVLQSGYSNIRLESQLFTLESFEDVRRVLKPTGVFAVYNFFRQGWIASRIRDQLRAAFDGGDPVALTVPPTDHIPLELGNRTVFTIMFAGRESVLEPIRAAFREPAIRYWYPWMTGVPTDSAACFSASPPAEPPSSVGRTGAPNTSAHHGDGSPEWLGLRPATIEEVPGGVMATDDWPFLYVRHPGIPGLTARGIALTLALSVGLWGIFGGLRTLAAPAEARSMEWGLMVRSFFLGAGFMLVETRAVVQMGPLFGGTWLVNTVVIAAILVMSLIGNLYAGHMNPRRLAPYYLGLFLSLAVGASVSPNVFLGMPAVVQTLGACLLVFAPIAFAGVIFATSFKRSNQPDRMFGANVAGALIGGLAENSSVLLGFRLLLCVAMGFYLLSAAFGNRHLPARAAEHSV